MVCVSEEMGTGRKDGLEIYLNLIKDGTTRKTSLSPFSVSATKKRNVDMFIASAHFKYTLSSSLFSPDR